ncbi:HIT family protein [Microbispora rosea]|uniref:HIT family protein n=1 Tax=Microbispora rosea TaxID=58117 RepID=UPI0037B6B34E
MTGTTASAFARLVGGNREALALTTRSADLDELIQRRISVVDIASATSSAVPGGPDRRPAVERKLPTEQPIPYPDGLFDGLWMRLGNADHEWNDLHRYARILTPGGVMSLTTDIGQDLPGETLRRVRELDFRVVTASRTGSATGTGTSNTILAIKQSGGSPGSDDCAFCPELRFLLNRLENLPGATGVLWGDEDFFVIPDLAPLDEGHLLVVSVRHELAMGAFPGDVLARLEDHLKHVSHLFRSVYGREALFFEHGPATPGEAGSCIDHAHMHCLPANTRIFGELRQEGVMFGPASLADLRLLHRSGKSYLFLQEAGERLCCSAGVEKQPNQVMRRAYSWASQSNAWRWQTLYMRAASRHRYMATLNRLLPAADEILTDLAMTPHRGATKNTPYRSFDVSERSEG